MMTILLDISPINPHMNRPPQIRPLAPALTASTLLMLLVISAQASAAPPSVWLRMDTTDSSRDTRPMRAVAKAARAMARDLLTTHPRIFSPATPDFNAILPPEPPLVQRIDGLIPGVGDGVDLAEHLLDLPPPTA